MPMRKRTGQSEPPWGRALRLVDAGIYKRIDPTVETTL
jgi:hypothetical protein